MSILFVFFIPKLKNLAQIELNLIFFNLKIEGKKKRIFEPKTVKATYKGINLRTKMGQNGPNWNK